MEARSWRVAGCVLVLLLATCVALDTVVKVALLDTETPAPDSLRARIVRAFPVQVETAEANGVFEWATAWVQDDEDLARDWLEFGQRHARRAWRFYVYDAQLLLARGERDAAEEKLRAALLHARIPPDTLRTLALLRAIDASRE